MNRRELIKAGGATVAALGASALGASAAEVVQSNVKTSSQPSALAITDVRVVRVGPSSRRFVLRLDTNQGISGLGEVRDGASPTYALMLKSRLLGMNPCHVDKVFRRIKQFGGHARQGGGVCAVEEACFDLAGKAWGVPCWQMLGGKFRDKIRVYCDTPSDPNPEVMGRRLKERVEHGYTFLKMDISINLLKSVPGGLTFPKGQGVDPFDQYGSSEFARVQHPFTGIRITDKGLKVMADYVATVRDIVGWETPIASDHYGHFGIEDGIKLAQVLDPFNLAWLEDMVPWQYTDQYVRLKHACKTPILTGEDIYLKEGFLPLFEKQAIAICHPDIATSGGLLETKKIGDLAMEHGISMALHMAGSPVTMFSSVHCAAATENFLVMEHHNVDDAWYDDLVTGVPKPLVKDGFIAVPDGPGLGIELNEAEVRRHLKTGEQYFAPTPEWNDERSWDRTWS